jgi:hypothetical protein
MTGVQKSPGGYAYTILCVSAWWHGTNICETALGSLNMVANILLVSLSIPFFPPARSFVTLEASVKKAPEFAYQVYFADEASTKEIENNVSRAENIREEVNAFI